jgi:hypothetical protein
MTSSWHLAQINVGTIKYPADDERMSGFMSRLDEINALADESPGFVWRMQSDSGNATDIDVGGGPFFIANMSVWTSIESLFEFVYRTDHRDIMIRRRDWFERPSSVYQALWWVPAGHKPTAQEGLKRIARLEEQGPTPEAFNFQTHFPPPDGDDYPTMLDDDARCSGWD